MKIGIFLFEQYHGKRANWAGSSRIRGNWLAKHWDGAEIFKMGQEYDVIIYQKAYWVEHAKNFKGIKILDMCDPDFMDWGYPIKEMIEECDAVTTSTQALADAIQSFTKKPVICIPDRMDLDFHKGRKYHSGTAKWAVWFGYSTGFEMLKPVCHFLKKFNLNLIVIADQGFVIPSSYRDSIEIKNLPWNVDTINDDILQGDIVLNPQGTRGKWRYKSNNKTLTAWSLGMPVAHDVEALERFIDPEERRKEVDLRLQEIKDKWDVKYSVQGYKDLIDKINAQKNEN